MRHDDARRARLKRELRATALLSAPLVVGQLSSMGMNVIDTVLAGRHGTQTLAAIGVGAPAWSVVILLCIGVLMAVPPSVAQLDGAGRRGEIATHVCLGHGTDPRTCTWWELYGVRFRKG